MLSMIYIWNSLTVKMFICYAWIQRKWKQLKGQGHGIWNNFQLKCTEMKNNTTS